MTIYSLKGGGTETEEGGGDERKTAEKEELVKKILKLFVTKLPEYIHVSSK